MILVVLLLPLAKLAALVVQVVLVVQGPLAVLAWAPKVSQIHLHDIILLLRLLRRPRLLLRYFEPSMPAIKVKLEMCSQVADFQDFEFILQLLRLFLL